MDQSFKHDRFQRCVQAGVEIQSHLHAEPPDLQKAWDTMKGWYRHFGDRPTPPSRVQLEDVTNEYTALYTREAPPGEPIPVVVAPVNVPSEVPSDEEIRSAVRPMRRKAAPGPSGLRIATIKQWLDEAEDRDSPNPANWNPVVELVQYVYISGEMPSALPWATLVLIPKTDGSFRGIGLLEVVWKILMRILDARIKGSIQFHDALHGFQSARGTGTAIIEAKLLQSLSVREQEALHMIFLDLRKAYDTLDRARTLDIIEQYGVGDQWLSLLRTFWESQQVAAAQAGYFGTAFQPSRGVVQGDIISPTIFNIVCDAIIRAWILQVSPEDRREAESRDGFGAFVRERLGQLYADDGLLASRNADWLH